MRTTRMKEYTAAKTALNWMSADAVPALLPPRGMGISHRNGRQPEGSACSDGQRGVATRADQVEHHGGKCRPYGTGNDAEESETAVPLLSPPCCENGEVASDGRKDAEGN